MAEAAIWRALKDAPVSMVEIMDVLKEGGLQKISPKPVFVVSPGYAHLPDGLNVVYAMIALLSEGKYDEIIRAPNREVEATDLITLWSKLSAVWSVISNAMRGLKDRSLQMLVLHEVFGLELFNISR